MIEFVRSFPQGVFWYPLVLVLVFALGRLVVQTTRIARSRRTSEKSTHVPGRYAHLVAIASSDSHAREELERLCIGLLLEASGYGGYSVERCRSLMAEVPGSSLEQALAYHLGDTDRPPTTEQPTARAAATARTQADETAASAIKALPPLCQIVVKEAQKRTEE
jgi:hypothetical protein